MQTRTSTPHAEQAKATRPADRAREIGAHVHDDRAGRGRTIAKGRRVSKRNHRMSIVATPDICDALDRECAALLREKGMKVTRSMFCVMLVKRGLEAYRADADAIHASPRAAGGRQRPRAGSGRHAAPSSTATGAA